MVGAFDNIDMPLHVVHLKTFHFTAAVATVRMRLLCSSKFDQQFNSLDL